MVHLDTIFWGPDWVPVPQSRALPEIRAVIAGERWILDGDFLDADRERFDRADTVYFLDLPRRTCLRRALWRLIRDRRRRRPDLPEGAHEVWDWQLLRWIWRYPTLDRPLILGLLSKLPAGVEIHHIRTTRDLTKSLPAGTSQTMPPVAL